MNISYIRFKQRWAAVFCVIFMFLIPMQVQAQPFEEAGAITEISLDGFFIEGQKHRFWPEVEVRMMAPSEQHRELGDLQMGDEVFVTGSIVNGVRYIQLIIPLPEEGPH